jgi:transcriptional regulator with XRE-family HTH domain
MDAKEFGKYIEKSRLQAGFRTRDSLAQTSGVWGTTIARIEEGRTKTPSIETLKRLAPFLKIPYEDLLKAAGFLEDNSALKIETAENRIYNELDRAIKDLTLEEQKAVLQFIKFTKAQRDEKK